MSIPKTHDSARVSVTDKKSCVHNLPRKGGREGHVKLSAERCPDMFRKAGTAFGDVAYALALFTGIKQVVWRICFQLNIDVVPMASLV